MKIMWEKKKLVLLFVVVFMLTGLSKALAEPVRLTIDGELIETPSHEPAPMLVQGRTLVPIRIISERLGADVEWVAEKRQVRIEKKDGVGDMRIDNRLMVYNQSQEDFGIVDVAPRIVEQRTFVPLRVVSYMLDVSIDWDADQKMVIIDSGKKAERQAFFSLEMLGVADDEKIEKSKELRIKKIDLAGVHQLRFILADRDSLQGRIICVTNTLDQACTYIPAAEDEGKKILIAALYDKEGNLLSATHKRVEVALHRQVSLSRPAQDAITQATTFSAKPNFRARYVKYHMFHHDKNKSTLTDKMDPYGDYTFRPSYEDNGAWTIYAVAYDRNDQGTSSEPMELTVKLPRTLSLGGVSDDAVIREGVTLSTKRNFDVTKTQYVLYDTKTQKERILAEKGYGNHTWVPTHEEKGTYDLWVRVWDVAQKQHESKPVRIVVDPQAFLRLQGVGPKAVLTTDTDLTLQSNVDVKNLELILTQVNNKKQTRLGVAGLQKATKLSLKGLSSGDYRIKAVGQYKDKSLETDEVAFKIYTQKTYGAKPIVSKADFQPFVAKMALVSKEKTSMSAALQTAQAILETGWGQSVPVDKYSGTFSNNLFGIKGSTSHGSVVSNTWEEYNGVPFRTDASFRAYPSAQASWDDHKALLLKASRYQIFRDVMPDPVLGAYAIRRAGYATDSRYPMKLIDIMDRYELWDLDKGNI